MIIKVKRLVFCENFISAETYEILINETFTLFYLLIYSFIYLIEFE